MVEVLVLGKDPGREGCLFVLLYERRSMEDCVMHSNNKTVIYSVLSTQRKSPYIFCEVPKSGLTALLRREEEGPQSFSYSTSTFKVAGKEKPVRENIIITNVCFN